MEELNFIPLNERPRPTVIAATGLMLLAFVGLIVSGVFAMLMNPGSVNRQWLMVDLLYYLPFVLLPVALYCLRRRGLFDALRLNPMPVFSTVTVALAALLSVYAASALDSLWGMLLDALGLSEAEVSIDVATSGALTLAILHSAALPAVCEELLFRGVVFSALESRGTRRAAVLSALFFALMHGNLYGLPAYFMVGLISAFLVFALDSLYAGIVYHTVYNAAILVIVHTAAGMEDVAMPEGGALLMTVLTDVVVIGIVLTALLVTLNLRRKAAGVEAIPRSDQSFARRERALMAALFLLLAGATVAEQLL